MDLTKTSFPDQTQSYIKEEKAQKKIIQEVKILRSLDNDNIIKILEVFENKKYVFIVTEFASLGNFVFESF